MRRHFLNRAAGVAAAADPVPDRNPPGEIGLSDPEGLALFLPSASARLLLEIVQDGLPFFARSRRVPVLIVHGRAVFRIFPVVGHSCLSSCSPVRIDRF